MSVYNNILNITTPIKQANNNVDNCNDTYKLAFKAEDILPKKINRV